MHSYEQRTLLLDQLNFLAKINHFEVKSGNTYSKNVSFLDSKNSCIVSNIEDSHMMLPTIFNNYPNFYHNDMIEDLNVVMNSYLKAIGLDFNMQHMTWDRNHYVCMKEQFTQPTDVSYYALTFVHESRFDKTSVFSIRLYTEQMNAFYNVNNNIKESNHDSINLGVYYKDIKSIIYPMLSAYKKEVENTLGYPITVIDAEIIKVLDMLKIA